MKLDTNVQWFDALYGDIGLSQPLADLLHTPAVQRLRNVRLSNIDSLSMPGIANISRYEHAIGTTHLAGRVGFGAHLNQIDTIILQAGAMLHDAAITAFGHLMEEALRYVSASFDHEMKLSVMLRNTGDAELGGINLQLFAGRESGIRTWAERVFKSAAEERLHEITNTLSGGGRFGRCISGDVDLDNLDNLTRIAFHMGLNVERKLPTRIASRMVGIDEKEGPIFSGDVIDDLESWLQLRWAVYNRLMLSQEDFAGKVMLIYAMVTAYNQGDLGPNKYAWTLTDDNLIQCLLKSKNSEVVSTVHAWMLREIWPLSDLVWMQGKAPDYVKIYDFCEEASALIGRPCFVYAIRDKRFRLLKVHLDSGEVLQLGRAPDRWVLGIASRLRTAFTAKENQLLQEAAAQFFNTRCLGRTNEAEAEMPSLFQ